MSYAHALALPFPLTAPPVADARVREIPRPATPPTAARGNAERGDAERGNAERVSDERAHAERALVLAAQAGDARAFAGLVRLHQRRAYVVARAIVLTHEDAEDAVQEGFLHAYNALDRFRPEQAFGAWLHRIVANAALDAARRRKVRDADELPESVASPRPRRDPAERDELRARLRAGLAQLGERQRAVIVLHDVQGFKHVEIGAMLGIPEGTARSDLHHARAALRRLLGDVREAL